MVRTRIRELLQTGQPGQTVTVQGWVRSRREAKGFTFVDVNDGSSLAGLQGVIRADLPEYDRHVKDLTTGAAVTLVGDLVASPGQGQRVELQVSELTVVGGEIGRAHV